MAECCKADKHLRAGAQLADGGRLDEAVSEYNQAIAECSKASIVNPLMLASTYHGRGRVYLQLEQFQQAIDDFNEALRLVPQHLSPPRALVYHDRGIAYASSDQAECALQDFDEAIRLNPKDTLAYSNRARVYTRLNRDSEAKRDMGQATKKSMDDLLSTLSFITMRKSLLPFNLRGWVNILGLHVHERNYGVPGSHWGSRLQAGGSLRSYLDVWREGDGDWHQSP